MRPSLSKAWTAALLLPAFLIAGCGSVGTTSQAPPVTSPPTTQGFWDASNMPAAKNVMMFKFLNRTNEQFPNSNVFWTVKITDVTHTHSIQNNQFYDITRN